MMKAIAVVMCKTCHGDRVHFLAIEFEDVADGKEGWMENPPAEVARMCMAQRGVLTVYVTCNKSP